MLEVASNHWLPCIQMLTDQGIDVYAKVSAMNGKYGRKMGKFLNGEIDKIHTRYQGTVYPWFHSPGSTFETQWMYDAIEYSRNKNLKVAINGPDAEWTIDCVIKKQIDLVVIFKSRYLNFVDQCGEVGPGKMLIIKNENFFI